MTDVTAHQVAVEEIERAYAAIPPGSRVRLAKTTSNLFRFRDGRARRPAWTYPASGTSCRSARRTGRRSSAA